MIWESFACIVCVAELASVGIVRFGEVNRHIVGPVCFIDEFEGDYWVHERGGVTDYEVEVGDGVGGVFEGNAPHERREVSVDVFRYKGGDERRGTRRRGFGWIYESDIEVRAPALT